jgi:creatinine amidohydrolase
MSQTFTARPYVLAETNWKTVQATDYQVAILPWGATEAHNYHLPYATDTIQCDYIAAEAARLAWAQNRQCIVLPTVPFGVNTGQLDVKLCLNMNPSTQFALLCDLADVLARQGIRKLILLNGHGGNHFKQMIRELYPKFPQLFVCAVDWFRIVPTKDYFDQAGDHAGELETSAIMHIAPQWVRPLTEAGNGAERAIRLRAVQQGWASTQREWTRASADTGVGDPKAASAEKGQQYLAEVCARLADFLAELADIDLQRLYEGE